ncbi:hypothetical protein DPMN_101744 [Dreissena polymorpha]|uniref:Uncharacterized protein n=1 Tax=Dreissena polymorpha TaxID=45954 RepID=A0A9D4RA07_DREPO|nr:hypothetical protein DPMN_101744 [Dreissena polymorpha]
MQSVQNIYIYDRRGLVDRASASGSGGRWFEPHGERFDEGWMFVMGLVPIWPAREPRAINMNGYRLLSAWRLA